MPQKSEIVVAICCPTTDKLIASGKQMISAVDKNQIYLYSGIAQGYM